MIINFHWLRASLCFHPNEAFAIPFAFKVFAEEYKAQSKTGCDNNGNSVFTPVGKTEVITAFWQQPCVKECFKKRTRYHIDETSQ